jgi:iron complex transport system ATP-binding protein
MNKARGIGFADARFRYAGSSWSLAVPDLRLGTERVTCIVGPNGSGKSTLLRLAAGILQPDRGAVRLDGRTLTGMARSAIARRIGFLPQESAPLFDYSVEMVVQMGRYAHGDWLGALAEPDRRAVDAALEAVAMEACRQRPLSHLSGGERRRALIASVLAQQPDILLLDEPTASLDIHHAAAVMRLLSGTGTAGRAVVIVTHDINLAALFADRMLLLVDGRVAADGAPADVVCEAVIRRAYGEDILVRAHPETGGPMVVARRGGGPEGGPRHAPS